MKLRMVSRSEVALTLFEVGVVLALLVILAAVFLPVLASAKRHSARISCFSQLKQVGLAYRIWEGDHNDKYPMAISVTNGGTRELTQAGNAVASYQVMSNELISPKVLICTGTYPYYPGDTSRVFATNFATLSNSNISYFVSVDVDEANPQYIISGDSDLLVGGRPVKAGLLLLRAGDLVDWQPTWHGPHRCNLGMNDGSVQGFFAGGHSSLAPTGPDTNRWAIP
jgi:type II secretory pathway pseudopilin PulG